MRKPKDNYKNRKPKKIMIDWNNNVKPRKKNKKESNSWSWKLLQKSKNQSVKNKKKLNRRNWIDWKKKDYKKKLNN